MALIINFSALKEFIDTILNKENLPLYHFAISLEMNDHGYQKIFITWYFNPDLPQTIHRQSELMDIEKFVSQIFVYLQEEAIPITSLAITLYTTSNVFDVISKNHPDKINKDMIRKTIQINGINCHFQILRIFDAEDLSVA